MFKYFFFYLSLLLFLLGISGCPGDGETSHSDSSWQEENLLDQQRQGSKIHRFDPELAVLNVCRGDVEKNLSHLAQNNIELTHKAGGKTLFDRILEECPSTKVFKSILASSEHRSYKLLQDMLKEMLQWALIHTEYDLANAIANNKWFNKISFKSHFLSRLRFPKSSKGIGYDGIGYFVSKDWIKIRSQRANPQKNQLFADVDRFLNTLRDLKVLELLPSAKDIEDAIIADEWLVIREFTLKPEYFAEMLKTKINGKPLGQFLAQKQYHNKAIEVIWRMVIKNHTTLHSMIKDYLKCDNFELARFAMDRAYQGNKIDWNAFPEHMKTILLNLLFLGRGQETMKVLRNLKAWQENSSGRLRKPKSVDVISLEPYGFATYLLDRVKPMAANFLPDITARLWSIEGRRSIFHSELKKICELLKEIGADQNIYEPAAFYPKWVKSNFILKKGHNFSDNKPKVGKNKGNYGHFGENPWGGFGKGNKGHGYQKKYNGYGAKAKGGKNNPEDDFFNFFFNDFFNRNANANAGQNKYNGNHKVPNFNFMNETDKLKSRANTCSLIYEEARNLFGIEAARKISATSFSEEYFSQAKKLYHLLSKKLHPDRNNNKENARKFLGNQKLKRLANTLEFKLEEDEDPFKLIASCNDDFESLKQKLKI